jgi:hypothetical protein
MKTFCGVLLLAASGICLIQAISISILIAIDRKKKYSLDIFIGDIVNYFLFSVGSGLAACIVLST